MSNRTLARRYAVALGELAQEEQVLDQVEADLDQLAALLNQSEEFYYLFHSEKLTRDMQADLVRQAFSGKVHHLTLQFLLLLVSKRRAAILADIVWEFHYYADSVRRVLAVSVTTAVPLEAAQKEAISQRLAEVTGQPVRLELEVDPAILGGVTVRIADKVIDGSVQGRLRRLQASLQSVRFTADAAEV